MDARPRTVASGLGAEETLPEALSEVASIRTRLMVLWEGGSAAHWVGSESDITVGRSAECDLVVDHRSVSRVHARLRGQSPLLIEDLGSVNGVRVRGKRIAAKAPTPVFPGDIVEIGSTILVLQAPLTEPSIQAPEPQRSEPEKGREATDRLVELVSKSDISVVLLGETGVGKSFLAEVIHHRSARAQKPLVRINCAALPENLLENELFGHEPGAFTGAAHAKAGLLESANGGTALLDEIGDISPATQAKLLSVLENREVLRLGSLKPRPVDVRFIFATNRDLAALVAAGTFRRDLYFRLNGVPITIPPLRTRAREIGELARLFLGEAASRSKRGFIRISEDALSLLERHDWPGNVRELRSVMEHACLLCPGELLLPEHIPLAAPSEPPSRGELAAGDGLHEQVGAFERQRILEALEQCAGNQTRAAKLLGITRRALILRLEAYELPRPRRKP